MLQALQNLLGNLSGRGGPVVPENPTGTSTVVPPTLPKPLVNTENQEKQSDSSESEGDEDPSNNESDSSCSGEGPKWKSKLFGRDDFRDFTVMEAYVKDPNKYLDAILIKGTYIYKVVKAPRGGHVNKAHLGKYYKVLNNFKPGTVPVLEYNHMRVLVYDAEYPHALDLIQMRHANRLKRLDEIKTVLRAKVEAEQKREKDESDGSESDIPEHELQEVSKPVQHMPVQSVQHVRITTFSIPQHCIGFLFQKKLPYENPKKRILVDPYKKVDVYFKDMPVNLSGCTMFILRRQPNSETISTHANTPYIQNEVVGTEIPPSAWNDSIILIHSRSSWVGYYICTKKKPSSPPSSNGLYLPHPPSNDTKSINEVSLESLLDQLNLYGLLKHIVGEQESTVNNTNSSTNSTDSGGIKPDPVIVTPKLLLQPTSTNSSQKGLSDYIPSPTLDRRDYLLQCKKACNYSCVSVPYELSDGPLHTLMWIAQTLWKEYIYTHVLRKEFTPEEAMAKNASVMCTYMASVLWQCLGRGEQPVSLGNIQKRAKWNFLESLESNFLKENTGIFFQNDAFGKPFVEAIMKLMSDELQRYERKQNHNSLVEDPSNTQNAIMTDIRRTATHESVSSITWASAVSQNLANIFTCTAVPASLKDKMVTHRSDSRISCNSQFTVHVFVPSLEEKGAFANLEYITKDQLYEGFSYFYCAPRFQKAEQAVNTYLLHKNIPGATVCKWMPTL
jgi:hypothetical protein